MLARYITRQSSKRPFTHTAVIAHCFSTVNLAILACIMVHQGLAIYRACAPAYFFHWQLYVTELKDVGAAITVIILQSNSKKRTSTWTKKDEGKRKNWAHGKKEFTKFEPGTKTCVFISSSRSQYTQNWGHLFVCIHVYEPIYYPGQKKNGHLDYA